MPAPARFTDQLSFAVDPELGAWIRAEAEARQVSQGHLLRDLVEQGRRRRELAATPSQ